MKLGLVPGRLRRHGSPAPTTDIDSNVAAHEVLAADIEALFAPHAVYAAAGERVVRIVLVSADEAGAVFLLSEACAACKADGTVKVAGEQGADEPRLQQVPKGMAGLSEAGEVAKVEKRECVVLQLGREGEEAVEECRLLRSAGAGVGRYAGMVGADNARPGSESEDAGEAGDFGDFSGLEGEVVAVGVEIDAGVRGRESWQFGQ